MAKYGENQAPVEQQAVLTQAEVKILPSAVQENPSLAVGEDQAFARAVDDQVQIIMAFFLAVMPSNYASQVKGPFYTMQFQAAAEQIARIQVQASEIFSDSDYDFTRPEFLYQIVGSLVFPDAGTDGIPTLPSDIAQRKFVKDMAGILLQGATKQALIDAIGLLTSADVQIIEKAIEARTNPNTAYTIANQFQFEITVSKTVKTSVTASVGPPDLPDHYHTIQVGENGSGLTVDTVWTGATTGIAHTHDIYGWLVQPWVATSTIPAHLHELVSEFPDVDPTALLNNVMLVLKAIKPAHTLYEYRNLFRETFRTLFTDSETINVNSSYYDDLRKYWWGAARLSSTSGRTLTDRTLFSDPTRSFAHISIGAALTVTSGPNAVNASTTDQNTVGRYMVADILTFPVPADRAVVPFTTSPSSLSGELQVTGTNTVQAMTFDVATNQYIADTSFDWAGIEENEILTLLSGVNAGNYRFDALLGNNGGPVLTATGPAYQARMAPSLLRLDRRMGSVATGQEYDIVVDRLGVLTPNAVTEDVSSFFAPVLPPLPTPAPSPVVNFLFGSLSEPVAGDIYQSAFLTAHGPLVKDWGDFTMATKNDVTVTVNGVTVAVESVDPYIGRINLVVPVQVTPPPMIPDVVTVSYHWMPKAIAEMGALNTVGLVLNQWDRAINHANPTGNPVQLGAVSTGSRFQLGLELGPVEDQEPLYLGWRYLGLERDYTASLNDPTSLLLNQNPRSLQTDTFEVTPAQQAVSYEATTFPAVENWVPVGVDSGGLVGNGTYEVKADTVGSYGVGQPAFYYQMADLTLPATGRVVTRLTLDPATVTPTGVFTGVVFGTHDNRRSYIVGLLLLPPTGTEAAFRAIGFLLNPARPDLRDSWLIGPQTDSSVLNPQIALTDTNKLSATTTAIPKNIRAGTRFRIESGIQQGTYTVASVVAQSNGSTTIAITGSFPASISVYGGKYQTVIWEVDYSVATTYALTVNTTTHEAAVYCSGALFGTFLTATATTALAQPAQVGPLDYGYAGG